ncbi:MAG: hypothetical protein U0931_15605 [Vulcanimicrobiota bacterium]
MANSGQDAADWDAGGTQWKDNWTWQPPETAQDGDVFRLVCNVRDGRGGLASTAGTSMVQTVRVTKRGYIIYLQGSPGAPAIYRINANGTQNDRITDSGVIDPAFSPDGKKVCVPLGPFGSTQLFLLNIDGSGKRALTSGAGDHRKPLFLLDGNILFSHGIAGGNAEILKISTDISIPPTTIVASVPGSPRLAVSPDQSLLAYENSSGASRSIEVIDAHPPYAHRKTVTLSNPAVTHEFPTFLDNHHLAFGSTLSGQFDLYVADLTSTTPPVLLFPADSAQKQCCCVSPSGSEMVYSRAVGSGNFALYLVGLAGGLPSGTPRLLFSSSTHNLAYPIWRH